MLGFLTEGLNISLKKTVSLILIFSLNFSSMYLYHSFLIKDIINKYYSLSDAVDFGRTLFFIALTASALIGSSISDKISRRKLLLVWVLFGVISLSLVTILGNPGTIFYLIGLVGFSFGLGIPSCFAALVDYTRVEERGRISGLTQFSIFFLLLVVIMTSGYLPFGSENYQMLSIFLRVFSIIPLLMDPFERVPGKGESIIQVIRAREFLLFTIPWFIYNLTEAMSILLNPIAAKNPELAAVMKFGVLFQYAGALIFGIAAGIVTDRIGRKQPLIMGFILLGICYSLIGISNTPISWFIQQAFTGVGWGWLMVTYQWVILGDIAPSGSREKYYALGFIIPLILTAVVISISSIVPQDIGVSYISAMISFCLFVSVYPLLRAKETLPEEKMKDRRLREYLKRVAGLIEESKK